MSSWRRSSNGSRKTRPPTAAKGSTISASRGQGRGVVEVATLHSGGGAPRWLTRWLTLLTTATLLSQRAKPSPLWSSCARKPALDTGWHGFPAPAAPTVAGRRLACRRLVRCAAPGGGGSGESDPVFRRWCATGQGEMVHAKIHHLPSPSGVALTTEIPAGSRNTESPDPGCPAQPGLPRARSPCWTWHGQSIPAAGCRGNQERPHVPILNTSEGRSSGWPGRRSTRSWPSESGARWGIEWAGSNSHFLPPAQ